MPSDPWLTLRTLPRSVLLAVFAVFLAGSGNAVGCPECFVVAVIPDTQDYVLDTFQPAGGNHLDLIGRYVCENRSSWIEKSTGKQMPIVMLLHLGDMVQNGNRFSEWQIVSDAFDHLDACDPPVPYIVALGNHDYTSAGRYHKLSEGFNSYFGANRWSPYQCADPAECDAAAGEWFIGGGDPILAHSRNQDGNTGPDVDQPGRHRAAVIRAPGGRRFLFIGLELAFDFPPAAHPDEGDDTAWLKQVLNDYAGVPTILVHHSLFDSSGQVGEKNWESDSFDDMQGVWNELVAPYPQILMTLNGHFRGDREAEWLKARAGAPLVISVFRNYQSFNSSYGDGGIIAELDGWALFMVFDPGAREIRLHSQRIEDIDNDGSHDGIPRTPQHVDVDFQGRPSTVFSYEFPDARPAALDNCPSVSNPDQRDSNGDGQGDACTNEIPALDLTGLVPVWLLLAGLAGASLRRGPRPPRSA
jgi:hypothetical protein